MGEWIKREDLCVVKSELCLGLRRQAPGFIPARTVIVRVGPYRRYRGVRWRVKEGPDGVGVRFKRPVDYERHSVVTFRHQ
jgi:hypothetical protein